METFGQIMGIISNFISYSIIPWSVVVLVVAIIFRKSIDEIIGRLRSIKVNRLEFIFAEQNKIINKKIKLFEKTIKQKESNSHDSHYTDDNPEIEIPRIYFTIETAIKDKFGEDNNYNILDSLFENKKINSDTFIILDSMRSLRANIHFYADSQKITRKDIDNYRRNAERIINIIKAI